MAEILIKNGANPNNVDNAYGMSPFMEACYEGNEELIEMLIRHGADVNKKSVTGKTPIMYSLLLSLNSKKNRAIIELLTKHGADINEKDSDGKTALERMEGDYCSPGRWKNKVIEILKEFGAK